MPFFSRSKRQPAPQALPAGTKIFTGAPAEPLPPEVISELSAGCAADTRIQAAYAYWMYVPLPDEVPHHCIGLTVQEPVSEAEFTALTTALWSRIRHLAPAGVPIDFNRVTETIAPPGSVSAFFTRTAEHPTF